MITLKEKLQVTCLVIKITCIAALISLIFIKEQREIGLFTISLCYPIADICNYILKR